MRAVGLKTLKNKLSEYVRLAANGETVLVTDRDRVVAELIPPRDGRARAVEDAALADLVHTGVVTPPTLPASDPPARKPAASTQSILADLDRDRADR
ncbi:MAG: type II toxin-antitoxin system Phd/YefM family antitoxin [Planctomycetota bacterium]